MTASLAIHGWAIAGWEPPLAIPPAHAVALPAPGPHPRRARLPGLAEALARAAVGGRTLGPDTAVLLGTALGSLTETEQFLLGIVGPGEPEARPRAFTHSVHNAAAGQVARVFGARGENHTFVQGEVSFAVALLAALGLRARGQRGAVLLGAVDESTPTATAIKQGCLGDGPWARGEGGALLYAGGDDGPGLVLGRVSLLALDRAREPREWLPAALREHPVDALLFALAPDQRDSNTPLPELDLPAIDLVPRAGAHPSIAASGAALAVGVLSGELPPEALDLPARPRALGLLVRSRRHDHALLRLEAQPGATP